MILITTCTSGCFFFVACVTRWKLLFVTMGTLSAINHVNTVRDSFGKRWPLAKHVNKVDTYWAHYITVHLSCIAMHECLMEDFNILLGLYWLCVAYIIWVFKIGRQADILGRTGELFHGSTHVASSLGTLCLEWHLYNCVN